MVLRLASGIGDLGKEHNMLSARLHDIIVAQAPSPEASPGPAPLPDTVLISMYKHRNTPAIAQAAFAYVAEQTYADALGGEFLWGMSVPIEARMSKYGHLGTTECRTFLSGTIQHRDREVARLSRADEVDVHDAIEVRASVGEPPTRSRFAKASRRLQYRRPVPPPSSAATGVTPDLRRAGGEKTSAMAEGAELMGPR